MDKAFARTQIRQNFFNNRVVNDWNHLPDSIVSAPTIRSFNFKDRSELLTFKE